MRPSRKSKEKDIWFWSKSLQKETLKYGWAEQITSKKGISMQSKFSLSFPKAKSLAIGPVKWGISSLQGWSRQKPGCWNARTLQSLPLCRTTITTPTLWTKSNKTKRWKREMNNWLIEKVHSFHWFYRIHFVRIDGYKLDCVFISLLFFRQAGSSRCLSATGLSSSLSFRSSYTRTPSAFYFVHFISESSLFFLIFSAFFQSFYSFLPEWWGRHPVLELPMCVGSDRKWWKDWQPR